MAIQFQHAIDVARGPEQTFAVLDDLAATPKWLERCTGIEKLAPGPNAAGQKLKYSYKDGGRSGVMDGEITARKPNEHLSFRYWDKMMDVTVDFKVSQAAAGARLVHTIEITPKTFFAKMISPMIRKQLPKQTTTAMEKLRTLLESS
jgi:uncharacterized protein YndB with AHSA1/START domain